MLLDFQNLTVVDCLRSGALIVGFLATAFADKRGKSSVWLKVDALALVVSGLTILLFPGVFLNYQVDGDIDNLHTYLARGIGAVTVTMAAVYHLAIRDRDQASLGTWLMARALSSGASVVVCIHAMDSYSKGNVHLNDKFTSFAFLASLLAFVGHTLHMFRYGDYVNDGRGGAATAGDRTRLHMFIDLLVGFPFMLYSFAYPESSLVAANAKVGGVHLMLMRLMVAKSMTFLLFGLVALQSNSERDRRALLLSRLLIFMIMIPVFAFYQYSYGLVDTQSKTGMAMMGLNGLLLINASMGAFYRQMEERKRK